MRHRRQGRLDGGRRARHPRAWALLAARALAVPLGLVACGDGPPPPAEAERAAVADTGMSAAADPGTAAVPGAVMDAAEDEGPAEPPHAEEQEILSAVQRLFDAMAARDSAAVARAMHPEGHLLGVAVGEGAPEPRGMSRPQFMELVGGPGPPVIERMWDARVLVHDPIAVVWTPYDLYLGEQFSHCGVDALTMIRTDDGWKVAGGIYTMAREGCPESSLGPPGAR